MSKYLHAANVLISIVGTVGADTVTGGAASAVTGLLSLKEVVLGLKRQPSPLAAALAAEIETAFARHHLSETERRHIRQMIEQAQEVSPAEIMRAGRDPAQVCALMLRGLRDPALTGAAQRFTDVVAPLLEALLARPEVMEALRPAFEAIVVQSLQLIASQVEVLSLQMRDTAMQLGERDALVRDLARRYAPGSEGSFDSARLGLEQALEAARRIIDRGAMPSNLDAAVQEVLAEVARLVADQDFDAAAEVAAQERSRLLDEMAERQQAVTALLDTEIDLARSRNRPADAAAHVLERLRLEGPGDVFAALRATFIEWYERGRDKGLSFDLEVAIRLARDSLALARTAAQRGAAQNDLGIALRVLGSRETGTERLTEAVDAYRDALATILRSENPELWASTQINFAVCLVEFGVREEGTVRLFEAVQAYQLALEVVTREVVPQVWASTQNNLGTALQELGLREEGTERLKEAAVTFLLALEERRRELAPMKWAVTQNNLGAVVGDIAERERDPIQFSVALECLHLALEERSRETFPAFWAETTFNIALTELSLFDLTADPVLPQQALERLLAAREVYAEASPYHLAKCDEAIARARALLA